MRLAQPLRSWIAIIALLFSVATFPPVFWLGWGAVDSLVGRQKIEAYEWNDATKEAFQIRLSVSSSLFQTALVLIAAIWGTVLVKKTEASIVLKEWQEILMLLVGTFTLVSSGIAYIVFTRQMSVLAMGAAETGQIPDLTHRNIAFAFLSQCIALLGGATIVALTVISAMWLKREGTSSHGS